MTHLFRHTHPRDDSGQSMAEYSVVLAVVALVVALVLPQLGAAILSLFDAAAQAFGG